MASIASPLSSATDPTAATSPTTTSNALTTNALGNERPFCSSWSPKSKIRTLPRPWIAPPSSRS